MAESLGLLIFDLRTCVAESLGLLLIFDLRTCVAESLGLLLIFDLRACVAESLGLLIFDFKTNTSRHEFKPRCSPQVLWFPDILPVLKAWGLTDQLIITV